MTRKRVHNLAQIKNGRPENVGYFDASIPFAAGGLYSTVGDLYKWNETLATRRLLSEETERARFTTYPEAELSGMHYGYGLVITEKYGLNTSFNRQKSSATNANQVSSEVACRFILRYIASSVK